MGSVAVAQTTVDLTIEDARALARQALLAEKPEVALGIAQAILSQLPDDRGALVLVAAAAPQRGDAATGRKAGARAWALSDTRTEKYEAARLTALAAATEERYTLAEFWLRRALTVSPSEAETQRTTRDAAGVRRLNPWSTTFNLSIVPSNNINGGADDETLTAPGLPDGTLSPDALALAGVRATAQLRTQYRLAQTLKSRTTVALQFQASRVRLDDSSAPASISDLEFATDAADITLGYDRVLESGSISAHLTFGSYDYGREDYYDFQRLKLAHARPLNDRTVMRISGEREWQDYVSTGIGNLSRSTLRGGLTYKRENGDQVGATLSYTNSDGDSVNYTYEDWSLQGSYDWADPFGPVKLGISAGIKRSDYPEYALIFAVDGGREDQSFFYDINLGFPDVTYAGFTPGLTISGNIGESNISRFTRDTMSIGLTLKSTF